MTMPPFLKQILTDNTNETFCLVSVGAFVATIAMTCVFVYLREPTYQAFGLGVAAVLGVVFARRTWEPKL